MERSGSSRERSREGFGQEAAAWLLALMLYNDRLAAVGTSSRLGPQDIKERLDHPELSGQEPRPQSPFTSLHLTRSLGRSFWRC